jgi:hypothetical protein
VFVLMGHLVQYPRQHKGNPYAKLSAKPILILNGLSGLEQPKAVGHFRVWPEFTKWWFSTTGIGDRRRAWPFRQLDIRGELFLWRFRGFVRDAYFL